jgi:hypothetical protein
VPIDHAVTANNAFEPPVWCHVKRAAGALGRVCACGVRPSLARGGSTRALGLKSPVEYSVWAEIGSKRWLALELDLERSSVCCLSFSNSSRLAK